MDQPLITWAGVTLDYCDTERAANFWSAVLDVPVRAQSQLSFASPKGPPLCQKHGTTSCPLRPAVPMISEGSGSVKYVVADEVADDHRRGRSQALVSRAGGRTRLR